MIALPAIGAGGLQSLLESGASQAAGAQLGGATGARGAQAAAGATGTQTAGALEGAGGLEGAGSGPEGVNAPEGVGGAEGAGLEGSSGLEGGGTGASGSGFAGALAEAISSLEATQLGADSAAQSLATGTAKDPEGAIVTVEDAQMAMDLAAQIRNKAAEAAQSIFQTQV